MEGYFANGRSYPANHFMIGSAAELIAGGLERLPVPDFPAARSLDFSLESLKKLDDYMLKLRENLPRVEDGHVDVDSDAFPLRTERQLADFVYMFGGYTGEVIRRVIKRELRWITLKDLMSEVPEAAEEIGDDRPLSMAYSLIDNTFESIFPLNRVIKFLVGPMKADFYSFAKELTEEEVEI